MGSRLPNPLDLVLPILDEQADAYLRRRFAARVCGALGLSQATMFVQMEIGDPTVRPRVCLGCGGEFLSDGAHNRFCGACRPFLHTIMADSEKVDDLLIAADDAGLIPNWGTAVLGSDFCMRR